MKIGPIILAASAVLAAPAYAAIASGTSGNGELFLAVFDDNVSYTLDLGVRQNDFFVDGQKDLGYSKSWSLSGANWDDFVKQADVKSLQWSVVASETTGGTARGGIRLFTTVKSGQEGVVGNMTNQGLLNGIGSTQLGTFYSAVNQTGTHPPQNDFDIHGNSTNLKSDGNAYFGTRNGNPPTLNGNAPFSSANTVGDDSYFYFLTRSGAVQTNKVDVDQFDNASFKGMFSFDAGVANGLVARDVASTAGGYMLSYSLQPVPEPGTYALMLLGLGGLAAAARRRKAG
jgi:hypothetical protein